LEQLKWKSKVRNVLSFAFSAILKQIDAMSIRKQARRVREPFPVPQTPGIYKKIAYSFVALTVVIVVVALWFSSVRATVLITPAKESTKVLIEVPIAKEASQGELVGRVVQGVFEKTQEFTVNTGVAKEEIGTSTGKVKITNTYSSPQPLIKTTRLLTADGRLYRIAEGVTVPAGGSVTVDVYADEDGAAYDFSEKTNFTVPGLSSSMQKFVTAISVSSFEGGKRLIRALSVQDLQAAEKTLQDAVLEDAKKKLRGDVNSTVLSEAVYVVDHTERNTSANPGDETDHFLMSMKLNVTGVFYSKSDLDALVRTKVTEKLAKGRTIISKEPLNVTYAVKDADAANERATVSVSAEMLTIPTSADNLISKESIAGLPISDAEQKLQQMSGVEDALITIHPSWVRRLPTLAGRINVKISQ
jgi:hypothetical protein